jgi:hypothetical protein
VSPRWTASKAGIRERISDWNREGTELRNRIIDLECHLPVQAEQGKLLRLKQPG